MMGILNFGFVLLVFGQWDSEAAQNESDGRLSWMRDKKRMKVLFPSLGGIDKKIITNAPGYGIELSGKDLHAYFGRPCRPGEKFMAQMWDKTDNPEEANAQVIGEYSTKDEIISGLDIFYNLGDGVVGFILKNGSVSGKLSSMEELKAACLPNKAAAGKRFCSQQLIGILKYEDEDRLKERTGEYFFYKKEYEALLESLKVLGLAEADANVVISSAETFAQELFKKFGWQVKFEVEGATEKWYLE